MLNIIWQLLFAFVIIVVSAELFTNGIEWLGQRLGLSEGVVGSVLAALGTAMPETLIPLVAILSFRNQGGLEIGMGAIAGSPFMLTTLTMFICASAIMIFAKLGRRPSTITYNSVVLGRDLRLFISNYLLALIAGIFSFIPPVRFGIAAFLMSRYVHYVYSAFKHEGEMGEEPEQLHFDRLAGLGSLRLRLIVPQIALGLYGILTGAHMLVDHVQSLAVLLAIPPVVLALMISPVATELPEQVNSVLWSRTGKDTLALGNITGSLVFQSSFPVAFGIALTDWHLPPPALLAGIISLSLAVLYFILITRQRLKPGYLMIGGVIWCATICYLSFASHINYPPGLGNTEIHHAKL